MIPLEITFCIKDGTDPDRASDGVGGDGWYMRMDKAVTFAFDGQEFFTRVRGIKVPVHVRKGTMPGRYYLQTHPDATVANNLGQITAFKASAVSPPPLRRTGMMGQRR